MNITELRNKIDEVVKTNGTQSITGASLNEVLNSMVETLDDVYILDFTAVDLQDLEEERIESIKFDSDKLYSALQEGKRVYLREQTDLDGVYPVGIYAEDFLYVVMMTSEGIYEGSLPYSSEFTKGDVSYIPYLSKGWLDMKEQEVNTLKENVNTLRDDVEEHGTSIESLETQVDSHDILIEDLQDNKVDKGDYAPSLTAGFADNLVSGDVVVDSEFNARQSGGGAISDGVARMGVLKGNSVVWNELAPSAWSRTTNGITVTAKGGTRATVVGTVETEFSNGRLILTPNFTILRGGRKYLIEMQGNGDYVFSFVGYSSGKNKGYIIAPTDTTPWTAPLALHLPLGSVVNLDIRYVVVDLTLMFRAGNEPTTVEEFYARCPKGIDLFAPNAGEVIHSNVDAVKSVGRNLLNLNRTKGEVTTGIANTVARPEILDESLYFVGLTSNNHYNSDRVTAHKVTENTVDVTTSSGYGVVFPKRCLPNTTYFCSFGTNTLLSVGFYDDFGNNLGNKGSFKGDFTTPHGATWMTICFNNQGTYTNPCINISDPDFNGQYEPYREDIREIPTAIKEAFPEGMMSAGTVHDVAYNDANKEVGVTEKRIGVVDLGSLTWTYSVDYAVHISNVVSDIKAQVAVTGDLANVGLLCEKYKASEIASSYTGDKQVYVATNKTIRIKDSAYTDAASFKAAMSGVMLYYELATPEVTEYDEPFNLDYQVTNGGQEEIINSIPTTPLKAEIAYGFNASAKIKENANEIASLKATIAQLQAALASMVNENVGDNE